MSECVHCGETSDPDRPNIFGRICPNCGKRIPPFQEPDMRIAGKQKQERLENLVRETMKKKLDGDCHADFNR